MVKHFLLLCLFTGSHILTALAQDTIRLSNPSFDDDPPGCGKVPNTWTKIGKSDMLPDLQPFCHKVSLPPKDGSAYLSLVTSADGTWQGVSAYLGDGVAVRTVNKYKMSLWAAYSKEMVQEIGPDAKKKSFGKPAMLRIWGYNNQDQLDELLAETEILPTTQWTRYDFEIEPTATDFEQLDFEAYYDPEKDDAYNGNILIDHISDIIKINQAPIVKQKIALENPSFEDPPTTSKPPKGWINCGFAYESPTDILPGAYDVTLPAMDGKTYVGMVVRESQTYEAIGQKLSMPLQKDSLYVLSIALAHSDKYLSPSRASNTSTNFDGPARLRVWGSNDPNGSRVELLAESAPVDRQTWKMTELKMRPKKHDYQYMILEAYFESSEDDPYNGNLLIDHCELFRLH